MGRRDRPKRCDIRLVILILTLYFHLIIKQNLPRHQPMVSKGSFLGRVVDFILQTCKRMYRAFKSSLWSSGEIRRRIMRSSISGRHNIQMKEKLLNLTDIGSFKDEGFTVQIKRSFGQLGCLESQMTKHLPKVSSIMLPFHVRR